MLAFLVLSVFFVHSTSFSLVIPATSSSIEIKLSLQHATVHGSGSLSSVNITNNGGNMVLSGVTYDVIPYYYQNWQTYDLILIDLIGISKDGSDIAVVYLYLNSKGIVNNVYLETFRQPMKEQAVTGTVSWREQSTRIDVAFPSVNALLSPVETSLKVTGKTLSWGGNGLGWAFFNNNNFTWIPFATVDCSQCSTYTVKEKSFQGRIPPPSKVNAGGWYELHSILVPRSGGFACFGIMYLMIGSPSSIAMEYGFSFGNTVMELSVEFAASWSGKL